MTSNSDVTVEVKNASFKYPDQDYGLVKGGRLDNINMTCKKGDRVIVLGHNGSGKSTLLSVLGGKRLATGTATVLGCDAFNDTTLNHRVTLIGPPWSPEAYFANTVDSVASPAPDEARKNDLAARLHLNLGRAVDKMSSGEKRRVQILHGMLRPSELILLDECSTDIDVAERSTVLQVVRDETEKNGSTCLYATHILDGVKDWATHIMTMKNGAITSYQAVEEIETTLEVFAHRFMAQREARPFSEYFSEFEEAQQKAIAEKKSTERVPWITAENLTYKNIFNQCNFTVYKGSRTLLAGCNGCGKSTVLNMLGGKLFFPNTGGMLKVNGKACYDDMTLNAQISYCGDWWTRAPTCQVHVGEMMENAMPLNQRAEKIRSLLNVDLAWDVRRISSGEGKRVQLLMYLWQDKPLVILDEATADLDVDQRHELLKFLYSESIERGITVVYTTHIFEGLAGWATDLLVMDRTTQKIAKTLSIYDGDKICFDELTETLCDLKDKESF